MTHDELLEEINTVEHPWWMQDALRSIVELHTPSNPDYPDEPIWCEGCTKYEIVDYPCETILLIEKELA